METNTHVYGREHLVWEHTGWKYYNHIKKKAMEQEFSWSGLVLSLSIAFFVVIATALLLNFVHNSYLKAQGFNNIKHQEVIYRLEAGPEFGWDKYINIELLPKEKTEVFRGFGLS